MKNARYRLPALTALLLMLATAAAAQQQEVRPPIAQLWIDVATNVFFVPGAPRSTAAPTNQNAFGNTRSGIGRYMDVALQVRTRPQGIQATQTIPSGMRMGASLPLEPFKAAPTTPTPGGPPDPSQVQQPKGRVTVYWGCSAEVRSGQPRVLNFATASAQDWGTAWQGRYVPERGATAEPGHSVWPNDRNKQMLPDGNSLQGEHAVAGDGVPAGFRFPIGANQDLMPAIDLTTQGEVQGSILLQWRTIPTARSYFISAFGAKGDSEFVIWTSSDVPDAGVGLVDYLSNTNIDRWTADKVLLPASATQCAVPKGIFAGTDGAFVRMIAHGQEANLVFPQRPTDPKVVWEQQWAVRIRVKSTVMTILGGR